MGQLRKRLAEPLDRTLRRMHRDSAYAEHAAALKQVRTSPQLLQALSVDVEDMLKTDGSAQMMALALDDAATPPHRLVQAIAAAAQKLWAHREEILRFVLQIMTMVKVGERLRAKRK